MSASIEQIWNIAASRPKFVFSPINLSLLNFKCAARISTPRGTPIHRRARMRTGNFENDPYKVIKGTWVLSAWEWQQLTSTHEKYQFKHKNWKIPKIKSTSSMCSRGSSQIIKVVLVVLISGFFWAKNALKGTSQVSGSPLKFETP